MSTAETRPALIDPRVYTSKQWLNLGMGFLEGEGGVSDYEQAAFCLKHASRKNHKAQALLSQMKTNCRGVASDGFAVDDSWVSAGGICQEYSRASDAAIADIRRCPNCGACILPKRGSAPEGFICPEPKGGCGEEAYLSIEEEGLTRGFAIHPYRKRRAPATYSYFGRCVHDVKYNNSLNRDMKLRLIEEAALRIRECGVVERLVDKDDLESLIVVPAPSSVNRDLQLVHTIAGMIAQDGFVYGEPLEKRTAVESKNREPGSELAEGEIRCKDTLTSRTILLVDDTYGEGATLRACIKALKSAGVEKIYFLALCKNIFGGMKGRL